MFIIQHLRKCFNINLAKKSEKIIFCRNDTNLQIFLYNNYKSISCLYHMIPITTIHQILNVFSRRRSIGRISHRHPHTHVAALHWSKAKQSAYFILREYTNRQKRLHHLDLICYRRVYKPLLIGDCKIICSSVHIRTL